MLQAPLRFLGILLITLLFAACSDVQEVQQEAAETELPPGFLDEPPPGPESATTVFSGASLVTDSVQEDAVIVVQNGRLLTSGKRGEVDLPNDSVGLDMRNRWIVPGRQADLESTNLPNMSLWRVGQPANLLILDVHPNAEGISGDHVKGIVIDGEIRLFDTP